MRFQGWFVLMLVVSGVAPVAANAQARFERVRAEVDRTDQRIERARSLVSGAASSEASAELERAIGDQTTARSAFDRGRPRIALALTLRARAAADRAIAVVNGLPDPGRVQAQLDRSREVLERAGPTVQECDQESARTLLAAAEDLQRRAEEAAHAGRTLAAVQLTMGARERARNALRECDADETSMDAPEVALRRTDDLIQRAQDRVGPRAAGRAGELLARARVLQARAGQELKDRHVESSVRLTVSARMFANRAARIAGRGR